MNREILRLAVPNIISNLSIPLLGLADLALMGHLGADSYVGAVSLGGVIFNIIYWLFAFIRMGTGGLTAQSYGADNRSEAANTLGRALLLSVAGGVLLILLRLPVADLSFHFIDGSAEVEGLARKYYLTRVFAAPATIGLFALTGWFVGMQNTRIPMVVVIISNVLNITMNMLFVLRLGMDVAGVALATVIAQYAGLFISIYFVFRRYGSYLKELSWQRIFDLGSLRRFLSVNTDIFVRMLCMVCVHTFFNAHSATMGDTMLAVNSLLLQFLFFFSYLVDGFANASEALVGRFTGAGDRERLMRAVRLSFGWGTVLMLVFTVVYSVFASGILGLLTSSQEVLKMSREYLVWIALIPPVSFASFVWDGIYVGATATRHMRNSVLLAAVLVFFPVFFVLSPHIGNHALWLSFVLFMLARAVYQTLLARKAVYGRLKIAL